MKRVICRALAVLQALSIALLCLTVVVRDMGTSPQVMLHMMRRYAPPAETGLPADEYPAMAEMITAYLKGEAETFQYVYTVDGDEYLAFHSYEQQHMRDVKALFDLCERAFAVLFLLSVFLLIPAVMMMDIRRYMRWLLCCVLAVIAAVAALAVWAAIDFDSLFVLFHKLAFTNDLWLLNPRTDMLIRLMPTEFFVAYAAALGGAWLAMVLLMTFMYLLMPRAGDALAAFILKKRR